MVYTSLNVADNEKLAAAFARKYPGVAVNVNRQSAHSILQKILTERRAGKDIADAVLVGAEYLDLLQNRGIFQKYNSSEWKAETWPSAAKSSRVNGLATRAFALRGFSGRRTLTEKMHFVTASEEVCSL
jgi:ABC-type Fe3+ transport system substrate-binding protein